MPRYFEIIAATPKLARAKIKQQFGTLSILREERVITRDWRWLGFKAKSFYRIIVSEYRSRKPYLESSSRPTARVSQTQQPATQAPRKQNSLKPTEHPSKQLMKMSLEKLARSIEKLERSELAAQSAQAETYTLFDYPRKQEAVAAKLVKPQLVLQETSAALSTAEVLPVRTNATALMVAGSSAANADADAERGRQLTLTKALKLLETKEAMLKQQPQEPPQQRPQQQYQQLRQPQPTVAGKAAKAVKLKVQVKPRGLSVSEFLAERDFSPAVINEAYEFSYLKTIRTLEDKQILAEALAGIFRYDDVLGSAERQFTAAKGSTQPAEASLVFMTGGTGVGKTTTLSKLAFAVIQQRQNTIALASCDQRRMAAAAQLGSFANIIKHPLTQLNDKHALLEFYKKANQHAKLLFVDTPGCSVKEQTLISEVAVLMHYLNAPKIVYWCVPAAARRREVFLAYQAFTALHPTSLIFTKIDESTSLGSVLSLAHHSKLPIAYLCTGQDILKDFVPADQQQVKQQLLQEWS